MEYKNFQNQYENNENKEKHVWRDIGIGVLAVLIAVLTVVVINL